MVKNNGDYDNNSGVRTEKGTGTRAINARHSKVDTARSDMESEALPTSRKITTLPLHHFILKLDLAKRGVFHITEVGASSGPELKCAAGDSSCCDPVNNLIDTTSHYVLSVWSTGTLNLRVRKA